MQTQEWRWAVETFGQPRLGDVRRVRHLIRLAAAAATQPHGRISLVFSTDRERQGAYDFVECSDVKATALAEAVAGATARAAGDYPFVFAPVDGQQSETLGRHRPQEPPPRWLAAGLAGRHTRAFRNQREIDRAERAGGRMQPQPGPGSVAPVISGTTANERLVDWFRS